MSDKRPTKLEIERAEIQREVFNKNWHKEEARISAWWDSLSKEEQEAQTAKQKKSAINLSKMLAELREMNR